MPNALKSIACSSEQQLSVIKAIMNEFLTETPSGAEKILFTSYENSNPLVCLT